MTIDASFLTDINHELRTPLTAILGYSSLLATEEDPAVHEIGAAIHESGARLLRAVASVLELMAANTPTPADPEMLPGPIMQNMPKWSEAVRLSDLEEGLTPGPQEWLS